MQTGFRFGILALLWLVTANDNDAASTPTDTQSEGNTVTKTRVHANRLIHEKSPYLLQHAHNPVEWYPWGEEAFDAAKKLDRPIFLSIGYATCHWCHVMERESFENPQVAQLMNDTFVNVKIDREELP